MIWKEPLYAAAYLGLADCNSGLTWHGFTSPSQTLPRAEAAARGAIEIDPQLPLKLTPRWDSSLTTGGIGLGAETEFKRAVQLDPQYANAHHWYGDNLWIKGRHEEALIEAKAALKLDPLNRMIGTWVALRYYLAHRYDDAIEQSRSTVELDPNFAAAHLLLGQAYIQKGLNKEGLGELQAATKLSGDSPLYLAQVGVAQALAGRKEEALRIIAQLQKTSHEPLVSPYGLAQIYAALNDKEQTFKCLRNVYDDHAVWMSYLAVDPVFDHVRSDRRFEDLLRRLVCTRNASPPSSVVLRGMMRTHSHQPSQSTLVAGPPAAPKGTLPFQDF